MDGRTPRSLIGVGLTALLLAACARVPLISEHGDDRHLSVIGDGAAWRPKAAGEDWVPPGSAVFLKDRWWGLTMVPESVVPPATLPAFQFGDVIAASAGDLDGDGSTEMVVSYRHPVRSVPWDPRPLPTDDRGRSAHLGVLGADGAPVWLARRIPHPVGGVAACGPVIVLAYTSLADDAIVSTAAATWHGFGFTVAAELPGAGEIGCADVDADGVLDPVVRRRSRSAP